MLVLVSSREEKVSDSFLGNSALGAPYALPFMHTVWRYQMRNEGRFLASLDGAAYQGSSFARM
jgi:hypothetical protein